MSRAFPDQHIFGRVHATLQPALSVRPSVRRSVVTWVHQSIGPSVRRDYYFLGVFEPSELTAPAQMP